jgi:uncharacterized protein YaaN involved in tellurite resistance
MTMAELHRYVAVGEAVQQEILRARRQHAPMRGAHEGYAVMLEEVDELWQEVKDRRRDLDRMRAEAIQIAAMAICFVVEVCGEEVQS